MVGGSLCIYIYFICAVGISNLRAKIKNIVVPIVLTKKVKIKIETKYAITRRNQKSKSNNRSDTQILQTDKYVWYEKFYSKKIFSMGFAFFVTTFIQKNARAALYYNIDV